MFLSLAVARPSPEVRISPGSPAFPGRHSGRGYRVITGAKARNLAGRGLGVAASQHLGKHGDPVEVLFDDGTSSVVSGINRTANSSGGVRVVGRNHLIADWFQRRFRRNDVVEGRVLHPNRVLLLSKPKT